MVRRSKKSCAVFATLAMCLACAAPWNNNFPKMEVGLSQIQVDDLLGNPRSAESGPDGTKILYYRLASSPLDTDGSDTREYFVVMKEREVIGYGERVDAVTLQRAAMQFSAAWNAARMTVEGVKAASPQRVQVDGTIKVKIDD
jgi:hypothetical protein